VVAEESSHVLSYSVASRVVITRERGIENQLFPIILVLSVVRIVRFCVPVCKKTVQTRASQSGKTLTCTCETCLRGNRRERPLQTLAQSALFQSRTGPLSIRKERQ